MRKTTLDKQFLNIKQENKNLQKEHDKIKAQEVKIGDVFRQELSFSTLGDRIKIDHNAYAQKCNPEELFFEKKKIV